MALNDRARGRGGERALVQLENRHEQGYLDVGGLGRGRFHRRDDLQGFFLGLLVVQKILFGRCRHGSIDSATAARVKRPPLKSVP